MLQMDRVLLTVAPLNTVVMNPRRGMHIAQSTPAVAAVASSRRQLF